MKQTVAKTPMQALTFMRKEIVEVLRQPKLLLTLVFGPFLIMAAFGLGYRDSPKPLRTLFVAPANSPMLQQVDQYSSQLGGYIHVVGTSNSELDARRQLLEGKVDVVVSFPADPVGTVLGGKSAVIRIVHTRLDPIERTAISFASELAVDQINADVLASLIAQGQKSATPAADVLQRSQAATAALKTAYSTGDQAAVTAGVAELDAATRQLALTVDTTTSLVDTVSGDQQLKDTAASLQHSTQDLVKTVATIGTDPTSGAAGVDKVDQALGGIRNDFQKFASVDPSVIVRPFQADVQLAVPNVDRVTDWYAPAAVVLLIQQFGVAFGALTFVREKALGITEVYRIAPVGPGTALVGKYSAYLVIGSAIAAALTALVVSVLKVPVAGAISDIAVVMLLTLVGSIGLGFVISLASSNDAQAVQYTLIVLLASLFFSGFFLAIGQMRGVAQFIPLLLPVSYGMSMLRDVMLKGSPPNQHTLIGLVIYGAVMAVLAWLGARRRMSGTVA